MFMDMICSVRRSRLSGEKNDKHDFAALHRSYLSSITYTQHRPLQHATLTATRWNAASINVNDKLSNHVSATAMPRMTVVNSGFGLASGHMRVMLHTLSMSTHDLTVRGHITRGMRTETCRPPTCTVRAHTPLVLNASVGTGTPNAFFLSFSRAASSVRGERGELSSSAERRACKSGVRGVLSTKDVAASKTRRRGMGTSDVLRLPESAGPGRRGSSYTVRDQYWSQ